MFLPVHPVVCASAGAVARRMRTAVVCAAGDGLTDSFQAGAPAGYSGPYNGGPFGEVVEVPAVAGPFNLGVVVVRGSIRINPVTAPASVVSNPFPTILQGIPLHLKTINVTLDRPGFTFNSTNCQAMAVTAAITSTEGAKAPVSSPFEAAYLVSHGGEAFPDLEIVLQGEGVTLILDGNTSIQKGITSSTFKTVPDAPISSFELKLPTGKYSILGTDLPESAHYNLCGQTL